MKSRKLKSFVSVFLACVMAGSLCGVTALADADGTDGTTAAAVTSAEGSQSTGQPDAAAGGEDKSDVAAGGKADAGKTDAAAETVSPDSGIPSARKAEDASAEDAKAGDASAEDAGAKDAKDGDAKAGDAKVEDAGAKDTKAGDTKAGDAKVGDTKAEDTEAGDEKTENGQPGENTEQSAPVKSPAVDQSVKTADGTVVTARAAEGAFADGTDPVLHADAVAADALDGEAADRLAAGGREILCVYDVRFTDGADGAEIEPVGGASVELGFAVPDEQLGAPAEAGVAHVTDGGEVTELPASRSDDGDTTTLTAASGSFSIYAITRLLAGSEIAGLDYVMTGYRLDLKSDLKMGEYKKLPIRSEWSSSDDSIAQIVYAGAFDGKAVVAGRKPGSVTITHRTWVGVRLFGKEIKKTLGTDSKTITVYPSVAYRGDIVYNLLKNADYIALRTSVDHLDIAVDNVQLRLQTSVQDQNGNPVGTGAAAKTVRGQVTGVSSAAISLVSGGEIAVTGFHERTEGFCKKEHKGKFAVTPLGNIRAVTAVVSVKDSATGEIYENVPVAFTHEDLCRGLGNCHNWDKINLLDRCCGFDVIIDDEATLVTTVHSYTVAYDTRGDLPEDTANPVGDIPARTYVSGDTVQLAGTTASCKSADGKTAYTFAGWRSDDVTVKDGHFTMPAKDVRFAAKWTAETVRPSVRTLTYKITGGRFADSAPAAAALQPGETIRLTPAPVRSGYTFSGWTLTGPDGKTYTGTVMPDEDLTASGSYAADDSGHGGSTDPGGHGGSTDPGGHGPAAPVVPAGPVIPAWPVKPTAPDGQPARPAAETSAVPADTPSASPAVIPDETVPQGGQPVAAADTNIPENAVPHADAPVTVAAAPTTDTDPRTGDSARPGVLAAWAAVSAAGLAALRPGSKKRGEEK